MCPRFVGGWRHIAAVCGEVFSHERIEGGLYIVHLAAPFVDIACHGDKSFVRVDFDSVVSAPAFDVGASEYVQSSSALRYFRVAGKGGDDAARPCFFLAAVKAIVEVYAHIRRIREHEADAVEAACFHTGGGFLPSRPCGSVVALRLAPCQRAIGDFRFSVADGFKPPRDPIFICPHFFGQMVHTHRIAPFASSASSCRRRSSKVACAF